MIVNSQILICVIIILVIVAITLGMINILGHYKHKYIASAEPIETIGGKITVTDDVCTCVNKFNKTGLIDDILNKTLNPILYVRNIKERLKYVPSCYYYTTKHLDQFKLLISEIHFCTTANKSQNDRFTLVYAGSSPNHKGFILNKMFPNMLAILIDPVEHLIYKSNSRNHYNVPNNQVLYFCCADTNLYNLKNRIVNIFDGTKIKKLDRNSDEVKSISEKWRSSAVIDNSYLEVIKQIMVSNNTYNNIIIEDFFKDNTAEFFKHIPNIIFVSNILKNSKHNITDLDICGTSAMTLSWINTMQPRLSMLKFQTPYFNNKKLLDNTEKYKYYFDKVKHQVDFISDYPKTKFNYIIGDEIIQAYDCTTSSETQLIFGNLKFGLYDYIKRRENLFYYNQIQKQYGFYKSNTDNISGIDNCGDCSLAQLIIENYKSKYMIINKNITIANITIANILSLLRITLNIGYHGKFLLLNKNITDIYKIQGNILLNVYILSIIKNTYLKPIDINIEKRYQIKTNLNIRSILSCLAKRYIVNEEHNDILKFRSGLMLFLSYNSTWHNQNLIYEYFYYYLTIIHGLTKSNTTKLLTELNNLYNDIHNADYSNKSDIIIESFPNKIVAKYKDFKLDISKDWYYIDDILYNKDVREIYLNAIMYDSRISYGGFINIPEIIYDIIDIVDYDNLYELSLGLHDMNFNNWTQNNIKVTNFTYIDCNGVNNVKSISDLKPIHARTIIYGYYNISPIFSEYLITKISNDILLIFITLDTEKTVHPLNGYSIQVPYSAINFMKEQVSYYITHITFHFQGPLEVIYKIKSFYEKTI
jgi:hypothetical protein